MDNASFGQVGLEVESTPCNAADIKRAQFTGRYIELRKLEPELIYEDLYHVSHGDPDRESVWKYMAYGPFKCEAEMREWLEKLACSVDHAYYSVKERKSDRYIGMMSLLNIDENNLRAEVGSIWYGKEYQRGVFNTDTIYTVLAHLFSEVGLRRVEWKCDSLNIKSRNAAERLGFSYEGLFKQHSMYKGRNRDTSWYSITDDEWPEVQKNYQKWYKAMEHGEVLSLRDLNRNVLAPRVADKGSA